MILTFYLEYLPKVEQIGGGLHVSHMVVFYMLRYSVWNFHHSVVTGRAPTHFDEVTFQSIWVPAFKAGNIYNIHGRPY